MLGRLRARAAGLRLIWLLAVAAVLIATICGAVARGAGEAPPPGAEPPVPVLQPDHQSVKDARRGAGERRDRRGATEAKEARVRSRTAHRRLNDRDALAVAREQFPGIMRGRLMSGHEPAEGIEVDKHTGRGVAVVKDKKSGRRLLMVSSLPLHDKDRQGRDATVDLGLERTPRGLEPRNPLVDLTVGEARPEFDLQAAGVQVRIAASGSATGQLTEDRVFYANIDTDTDAVVVPTPLGAEASWHVRSQDSPQNFSLLLDMPDGAVLRRVTTDKPIPGDPPRSFEVTKGDQKLAYVRPPIAYDADGEPVEVEMRQAGDRELVVSVAHRTADVRYPLLVDPVVEVTGGPDGRGFDGWEPAYNLNGGSTYFGFAAGDPAYGGGLYVSMPTDASGQRWYANGAYGLWRFVAPPGTYIYRARFYNWQHDPTYYQGLSYSAGFNGMITPGGTAWEGDGYYNNYGWVGSNYWYGDFAVSGAIHDYCFAPPCNPASGSEGNGAQFGIQAYGRGAPAINTAADRAFMLSEWTSVYLGDRRAPALVAPLPEDEGWTDDWGQNVRSAYVEASDYGLGVSDIAVNGPYGESKKIVGCVGNPYYGPCPDAWGDVVGFNVREGVNDISAVAHDIVGNTSTAHTWKERVDRSKPVVTLSGELKAADGKRIGDGAYNLQIAARDGSAGADQSGIDAVEVLVDGKVVDDKTNESCTAPDNCALDWDWKFRPEDYAVGEHKITVKAYDRVYDRYDPDAYPETQAAWKGRHENTSETLTIGIAQAASTEAGPGSVNLLTGNLAVSRDDVSVDAFASDLTVSRTHNSRQPAAGEKGMFGPGWVAGALVDEAGAEYTELVERTDGAVEVTLADATKVAFGKSGGAYVSPTGHEDLKLAAVADTFELADLDGNVVVFKKPDAAASSYLPREVRQASAANKTRYDYRVINGVSLVDSVLAPRPPGGPSDDACLNTPSAGCRLLKFEYAESTTATGTGASEWGDFKDRVRAIKLIAHDPQGGQMATQSVAQYSYDSNGRLRAAWDPRLPGLKETYGYDADGHLNSITPAGETSWTIAYERRPEDPDNVMGRGRLKSASRPTPAGTATTTVKYGIPLSGAGAPYAMGSPDVDRWAQTDLPRDATAIFDPGQSVNDPPTNATVYYLDAQGRQVNVAHPGGRISTTEYGPKDEVKRELTAANRERALASGSSSKTRAAELETQRQYNPDATEMRDELGPVHEVQLANGEKVQARRHTVITYDEGKPAHIAATHLPTTTTVSAQVPGTGDRDARVSKFEYDWTLRKPTAQVTDTGGLALKQRTVYDPETGLVTETRSPANPDGGDANTTKTIYYSAGANAADSTCANRAHWAGLACKTLPAAQPGTAGLPDLPATTLEYDMLNQVTKATETVGSETRTTITTYDPAGRKTREETTSTKGTALPAITYTYNAANGELETTSTTDGGTRTISREYDSVGGPSAYTDADGNRSTTTYDITGRPATTSDGKGSQTRGYNTAGDLVSLQDSAIGTVTGTYDADGQLTTERLSNGIEARTTYNEAGAAIKRSSVKDATILYEDQVTESIHGQWLTRTATGSKQDYTYDGAGRVTKVSDTRSGQCTVRDYAYNRDSHRTSQTVHPPAFLLGTCEPGSAGTVTTFSHGADGDIDEDRVTNGGYSYDAFGRTTDTPAVHAGGTALTNTYYADDRVRTIKEGTTTHTYTLDPLRRVRTHDTLIVGGGLLGLSDATTAAIHHYRDDSDSPAWIAEDASGMRYTRNIEGITGDLVAIQDSSQTVHKAQLTNLHGDVVGTATLDANASRSAIREANEFGVPTDAGTADRYQWIGGKQRQTALPTGIVLMGQRVYNPHTGRFLQVDPVEGGSANDYDYAFQDPVNVYDLDGRCGPACGWLLGIGARYLSRLAPKAARAVVGFFGRSQAKRVMARGITGYTRHGLNQAISRNGVGVSTRAILNAVRSPITVKRQPHTMRFVGRDAVVVLNRRGKVVTAWARNKRGRRIQP